MHMLYTNRRNFIKRVFFSTCAMGILGDGSVYANEGWVTIEAPAEAAKGSQLTIKLTVHHNANNIFHHINWAYLMAGEKEIARWEYGWLSLPEGENFTKEVTYTITDTVKITGEASCNTHGSKGKVVQTIAVRE